MMCQTLSARRLCSRPARTPLQVQDGRAQFELTLQRAPSKPLLNSPYRMVQDLMALVTDPESLLYAPPAGYWTDDDAFAQSASQKVCEAVSDRPRVSKTKKR